MNRCDFTCRPSRDAGARGCPMARPKAGGVDTTPAVSVSQDAVAHTPRPIPGNSAHGNSEQEAQLSLLREATATFEVLRMAPTRVSHITLNVLC